MPLDLLIDLSSFRCSDLGTISGEIYLRADDEFFPEERWNDSVLPVTNAWLHAVQNLVRGASWQERVRFMDGPFWVDFTMNKGGFVTVNLVESRLRADLIRHSVEVDPTVLLRDAVTAATQILDECRARGWSNSDIAALICRRKEAARELTGKAHPLQ